MEEKNKRIKELELVCSELEEEKGHMGLQLHNISFIQKQDDTNKPRLSLMYANITSAKDPADPFGPEKKTHSKFKGNTTLSPTKESIEEGEYEEPSLAAQIGIDDAGFASGATLDKVFEKRDDVKQISEGQTIDGTFDVATNVNKVKEIPSNSKIRASKLFATKDYFNKKVKQELNMIDESKEESPSNFTIQENYFVEKQKKEIKSMTEESNTEGISSKKPELTIRGTTNISTERAMQMKGEEHKQGPSIGTGVGISGKGAHTEMGIGGENVEENKMTSGKKISTGKVSTDRNVLSTGQGISVGIDPTSKAYKQEDKGTERHDASYGYTQDERGINIERVKGEEFEGQTEEEIEGQDKGRTEEGIKEADKERAKERIEDRVEIGTGERVEEQDKKEIEGQKEGAVEGKAGEQAERVKGEAEEQKRSNEQIRKQVEGQTEEQIERIKNQFEGKGKGQTEIQVKGEAEGVKERIERQEIGIGGDNRLEGTKVLTEEVKSRPMLGISTTGEMSQGFAGKASKTNELSIGGTNVISKERPTKEETIRPASSLGTISEIITKPTLKKSPFSMGNIPDISETGSNKGVNQIGAGERLSIRGKVNNEEVKAGEQKSSAEISIGTDKEQETKKTSAEKARTEATKAIQEKLANKIKEQKKKVEAALGTAALDVRASKIITFDFLALKKNPKITKILDSLKETNSAIIFSDYVYIIREDNMAHKSKRILYITEYSIFIIHYKTFQIQRVIPITDLRMLIIVKTSGSLLAFHFEKA